MKIYVLALMICFACIMSPASAKPFGSTIGNAILSAINARKMGRRVLKVNRAGVDFALKRQLNVQQDQYYGSLRDSAGFKVMVHDQDEPAMINELGFAIQPGTHTFNSLKKIVINNLPKPSCKDLNIRGFAKYTKSACLLLCRARFVISRCKCSSYDLRGLKADVLPCLPQQVKNCVWPAMEEFRNETNNCDCPVPCTNARRTFLSSFGKKKKSF